MILQVLNYVYEYRVGVQPEAALPVRWCSPARAPQAPSFPAAAGHYSRSRQKIGDMPHSILPRIQYEIVCGGNHSIGNRKCRGFDFPDKGKI
jgi:hypothetical protein